MDSGLATPNWQLEYSGSPNLHPNPFDSKKPLVNRQQNRISRHGWKIRRRLIQLILQCILVHRLHPDFTKRNLSIHISV